MFIFTVRDMCVSSQAAAVLEAVKHADGGASVVVNLSSHEVRIAPETAGATKLSDAIVHAGFDPVLCGAGPTAPGRGKTPSRIPFEGLDHDFSAASEGMDQTTLPAEALVPLAH